MAHFTPAGFLSKYFNYTLNNLQIMSLNNFFFTRIELYRHSQYNFYFLFFAALSLYFLKKGLHQPVVLRA